MKRARNNLNGWNFNEQDLCVNDSRGTAHFQKRLLLQRAFSIQQSFQFEIPEICHVPKERYIPVTQTRPKVTARLVLYL